MYFFVSWVSQRIEFQCNSIITSIAKTTSTADVISISSNPSGSFEVDISKPNSIETRNKVRSILRQKFGKYLLNWFI